MLNDILSIDQPTATQYQSQDLQIVGLLDAICQELELTAAMFQKAEERYTSIADYLGEDNSPLATYDPIIHPQGSAYTETTVKPPKECEFDVDVICQLKVSERAPQQAFLDLVYNRLAQRGCYTLKRMNRCVRVQYENEFHLDITPAIPDIDQGPNNILVADKELGRWKESNPKDYCTWFKHSAKLQPTLTYELLENRQLRGKMAAEPLPAPQFSKPVLNRVIQLLKRHRDQIYQGDKDAPISAIIATLATQSYQYHVKNGRFPSWMAFLRVVVGSMPNFIIRVEGQELVPNPANPLENYADKWAAKPVRREVFHQWHSMAVQHFEEVLNSIGKGKQNLFESLSSAYGDTIVKNAALKEAEKRKILTDNHIWGVSRNTGMVAPLVAVQTVGAPVLPVRKHTNFGI